jgi:hypothetical protein
VDIVTPQQVVGDYTPDRVQNGHHPFEQERFIRLQV